MDYIYRPMKRPLPDGEWSQVSTVGSSWGKRPCVTKGAASGVLTRERHQDARWWDDREFEYKIQRRPLGEWEDF